jgi:hypothetical protein
VAVDPSALNSWVAVDSVTQVTQCGLIRSKTAQRASFPQGHWSAPAHLVELQAIDAVQAHQTAGEIEGIGIDNLRFPNDFLGPGR